MLLRRLLAGLQVSWGVLDVRLRASAYTCSCCKRHMHSSTQKQLCAQHQLPGLAAHVNGVQSQPMLFTSNHNTIVTGCMLRLKFCLRIHCDWQALPITESHDTLLLSGQCPSNDDAVLKIGWYGW